MRPRSHGAWQALLTAVVIFGGVSPSEAQFQYPNWEGQTGGLMTPTAVVAPSPARGFGRPLVGFHLLDGGDVVGTHFQISLTAGLSERVEVGFTRSAVESGDGEFSSLFDRGFNNVHAKVVLLPEMVASRWPVISAGFITRWQREHIEDGLGVATQNADVYVVVTKELDASADVLLRLGGGLKVSNASLFGIAGNAPEWEPLVFGTGSVTFGRAIEFGAEYIQQPDAIDGLPNAEIPGTFTTFGRYTPARRLAIDVAIVRLASDIRTGQEIDIQARSRLVFGVSYRF